MRSALRASLPVILSVIGLAPAGAQAQQFTGASTDPDPATTAAPTTLVVHGNFPYPCGYVSTFRVISTSHVEMVLRGHASCAPESSLAYTQGFRLGVLAAGSHHVRIDIRDADSPDSLTVHSFSHDFDVIDQGPPPPPPPPPLPCPLFSHFTTSPSPANDDVPTHVSLFGCFPWPCGDVVGSRILGPTRVEVTLAQGTGCPDSAWTWSRGFDLGLLPAGSHNLIVEVRDAATPHIAQLFGTWLVVEGDAPPPPPPPPPPSGGPLFTGATTVPSPARTSAQTVLVARGFFPYSCGFVSNVRVSPTYVSMTVNRTASCPPESTLAWEQGFDLGFLAAGAHHVRIAIRDAGSNDSTVVHEFSHDFVVIDDGAPPPPTPPSDSLIVSRPNPFSLKTRFAVVLDQASDMQIGIYDLQGRTVRSIFRGQMPAGTWDFVWDGRRDDGTRAPAGVYFYRVIRPGKVTSRRVVLTSQP